MCDDDGDEDDDLEGSDDGNDDEVNEDEMVDSDERESEDETNETRTDLYGNLIDKKGIRIIEINEPTSSVIPEEKECDKDLIRKIRGQLNRLTSSNMPGISTFIRNLYKQNSLFQVNQCICQCISDLVIIDTVLSPLTMVSELALLICVLHENVGEEVGGHAINFFVKKFHSLYHSNEGKQSENKMTDNALGILCYLYAGQVIEIGLFSEVISDVIQDFCDKTIELVMFTLTTVGFLMRKDSPEKLKEMLKKIQTQSEARKSTSGEEETDKRLEFMLETMTAIRNNNILKVTSKATGLVHPVDRDELKSTLKNCLKRSQKVTPIPATLKQALSSNRWWIKVGGLLEAQKSKDNDKPVFLSNPLETFSENEEKLCRSLRLNTTPLRRSLFKAIITSSDFIESADRIVSLCKKTQVLEAAYVLIQIAIHERTCNPFYVHVCKRLAAFDRQYKLAVFFATRDRLKELDSMKETKRLVFASLVFLLVKLEVITLSVLKVIDFSDLSEASMQFLKTVLQEVMSLEETVMKDMFDRIPKKDHLFTASLRLFISCFMDDSAAESKTRDLLKAKIKLSKQLT